MRITVTEEHIRKGKPKSCSRCPIAIALRETYPDSIRALVFPKSMTVRFDDSGNGPTDVLDFSTPKEAAYFIQDFDNGLRVKPFSFDLPVESTEGSR